MFDHLLKAAHGLNGSKVAVSGPRVDAEGYIDRQCPAKDCDFLFKVNADDWLNRVSDEAVHCPFCGHTAPANEWFTDEQIAHAKEEALKKIRGVLGDAIRQGAAQFNRKQRSNSFIRISMTVQSGPASVLLPAPIADPMRLQIACSGCECRFAVIGSAFFCPACGCNDAKQVFLRSTASIRTMLSSLHLIRAGVGDADTAMSTARLLVEGSLQNSITLFQRLAEALYEDLVDAPKIRRNAFQNLSEGNQAWSTVLGIGYLGSISETERIRLQRYFQLRHLLAHTQGLVDQAYLDNSGDTTYVVGQRVVVREEAVLDCIELVEKLASHMLAATEK